MESQSIMTGTTSVFVRNDLIHLLTFLRILFLGQRWRFRGFEPTPWRLLCVLHPFQVAFMHLTLQPRVRILTSGLYIIVRKMLLR